MLKGDNITASLGKENKELSEVNHSWRVCVCVLPLCSGEGVSRGSSDRKIPTSSRALVTTGSLALKSLLKPCDDKQEHRHKNFNLTYLYLLQFHIVCVTVVFSSAFH